MPPCANKRLTFAVGSVLDCQWFERLSLVNDHQFVCLFFDTKLSVTLSPQPEYGWFVDSESHFSKPFSVVSVTVCLGAKTVRRVVEGASVIIHNLQQCHLQMNVEPFLPAL